MKRTLISAIALLACIVGMQAQTQVIAHRGFWKTDGSAQNADCESRFQISGIRHR